MSGFIAFHREAMEHPLFKGDSARLGAWLYLVASAAWKPTRFNNGGRMITIDRGQFCVSIRDLAEAWGWSKSAVDRFLTRLKTETMIETASGTGRLVITICNYNKYQDVSDDAGTVTGTPAGTAAGQQRDIKEQGNKETRLEEEEAKASPSLRERPAKPNPFPKPEWADETHWADFLINRKAKGTPNTATAHKRFMADISRLACDEWPPGKLLEHAAAHGWAGIYEPRETPNATRNQNHRPSSGQRSQRRSSLLDAIDAGIANLG